jgi:hypothetical protein
MESSVEIVPPGAAGKAVEQNLTGTLPREAVWSIRRVGIEESKTEIPVYTPAVFLAWCAATLIA